MKIIFEGENGICAIMGAAPKFLATLTGTDEDDNEIFPTEESKLIYIANKDLPTGTKYEITDADLSDRTFRNAWEYVAGADEKTSADLSAEDLAKYNMTENL
jgi:hypothetical protein